MTLALRDYQGREGALGAIEKAIARGKRRPLFSLATGLGKTVVFANLPQIGLRRLLVVAHREELLDQAADKLRHWNPGLTVQVDQADRWADVETLSAFDGELFAGTGYAVCASVATIGRAGSRRLLRYSPSLFDAVVIDECHHASAQSYQTVIEHLRAGKPGGPALIGCTATPFRADGADLSKVFDEVVYSVELPEAISRGFLVDIRAFSVPTGVSLDDVSATREDFRIGELADAVNTTSRNGRVVKAYLDHAADRKAIVFAADVQHSKDLTEAFLAAGVAARHVDGTTPPEERAAVFAWLREPGPKVLVNVGIATEGFDEPSISCVILARPTKSRVLFCFDEKTEVLTPSGWVKGRTVKEGEPVAAFLPGDGSVRWEPVLATVERPLLSGERMMELKSPTIDVRVTDSHRMVWRHRAGRARGRTPWTVSTAGELAQRLDGWELPVAGHEEAAGIPLTDDEIRFVGWVQTDGCVNRANKSIVISQSRGRLSDEVERVLNTCGMRWSKSVRTDRTAYGARRVPLHVYVVSVGQWRRLAMWIPKVDGKAWSRLEGMDERQWGVFMSAWHDGDGSKQAGQSWTRRGYHLAIADEWTAGWVQGMCMRRGWRANVAKQASVFMVHCRRGVARHVSGATAIDRHRLVPSAERPDEKVWCVSVPSGAILTRRNGKGAVVGQCQMIGRGTRLCPGKVDLIVIDLADVSSKHTLANAAALFGLPTGMDLGGTSAAKARTRVKELVQEGLPFAEIEQAKTLADLDRIVNEYRKVGLFWQPKGARRIVAPDDGRPLSALQWVDVGEDAFSLRIGALRAWVTTDMLGHAHLTIRRRPETPAGERPRPEILELSTGFQTLAEAIREADVRLSADQPKAFTDPNARWRKDPASEKQVALLRKFRVPFREPLTKGEAGILLDKAFARRGAARRTA